MTHYDHRKIEKKWQKVWAATGLYKTRERVKGKGLRIKGKSYVLDMFPYPSGDGLHVGHPKGYIATDVYSRLKKMQGYSILHPMGWDAFGLPAENYAIQNKIYPAVAVKKNIKRFKRQLQKIGFNYDWSREINTTDPAYYKWTQWIFLQMYKAGLAYQSHEPINWCPSCKTGLANEDLEDGKCERCGSIVEKRPIPQWVLSITKYADRLLSGLDKLDWPEYIKESQRNWIGRSEGVDMRFKVKDLDIHLEMYDSIPQTHMAQTFTIIAPEHPLVKELAKGTPQEKSVLDFVEYIRQKKSKGGFDHLNEMEGIFTGRYLKYPPANRELPIWVASYALYDYGTGIVNCSVHDERDFAFAKKYDIPLHPVLFPKDPEHATKVRALEVFYRESDGILAEPKEFAGKRWDEAREGIIDYLVAKRWAERKVNYKLRDWVFSRQRYWGEPIPLIHCDNCRTKKALLIHGFEGSGAGNWFPSLRKELEARGIEVRTPTMSTAKHPTVASWLRELEPLIVDFGPEDIVIGHSLGSKAALHLLTATKKKVGALYLVASAIGEMHERDWDWYRREWKDADVDALKAFWETPVSFPPVSKLAGKVTLILSEDDPMIRKKTHENLPAHWGFLLWKGFGHFTAREIPRLVSEILKGINEGVVPVPEKDLPVKLPNVKSYEPTGTGESPLAKIEKWVNVKCPKCKGPAKRETNTMPQWAGSCWYYLAYAASEKLKVKSAKFRSFRRDFDRWVPVDMYVGGAEHATRHLIYARFWHKFLFDIGVVSMDEPFQRLQNVGLILASDGRKMSKRFGNVINPDDIVEKFGADSLRVYEMFMGPFNQAIAWSTDSLVGARRFLERVWRLRFKIKDLRLKKDGDLLKSDNLQLKSLLHQTIEKVGDDIENFRFNTAVSALMILLNALEKQEKVELDTFKTLLTLLAPFAPHLSEELWAHLGYKKSIYREPWPVFDERIAVSAPVTIIVQVNGKVRGSFTTSRGDSKDSLQASALSQITVKKWVNGKVIHKVIVVPDRLVNIVIQEA